MKKIICLALATALMVGAIIFVAVDKNNSTRMGLGIQARITNVSDATEDKNGEGTVEITVATVALDSDGRILSCLIDTAANTVRYTNEGKAVAAESFATKYELGYDYSMKKYGAAHEWFEQVDAFTSVCRGKTLDEVKALVVNGYGGNDEVISAGCTIGISDFVLAIEKACINAVSNGAEASDTLRLGIYTGQKTLTDAHDGMNGNNEIETTVIAATVDKDGKITAAIADSVQLAFSFDGNGAAMTDAAQAVISKREQGDDYGMVAYAGAVKEWYAQADAFTAACVGRTAGDVASLMGNDGKGTADVQAAGCTIYVSGLVRAASKLK